MQIPRLSPGNIVDAVTIATQFVIGWLFFRQWGGKMARPARSAAALLLCATWCLLAIDLVVESPAVEDRTLWIPPLARSILLGAGTIWAFCCAVGLGIWFVWNAAERRITKSSPYSADRRRFLNTAGTLAVATPFAVTGFAAIVSRTDFQVREVDFPIAGLHPDFEGFRIAQVTDLHVSPYLSVREAGRVVDMANELKPHLSLVTGDIISAYGDPLDDAICELSRLRADLGVLGCLGNHEHHAMCEDYATWQCERRGISILRYSTRRIRRGNGEINIAGVDFQSFRRKRSYLTGAHKLVAPGMPNILLSHNPDVFPVAVNQGYDAIISGHTHGGQVAVEIFEQTLNLARFYTPYVAGLYHLNGKTCYVSRGIGTIGMPVRLGVPPELTLLRLRQA